MKFVSRILIGLSYSLSLAWTAESAELREAIPPVTEPPEPFFEKVRERDRDAARAFYKKHIDVGGMGVAASAEVDDDALRRSHTIVTKMLAGRPDIMEAMAESGMYLIIIGRDQVYTDMPEYRNHPDPDFQNERVRGTGGRPTSFGEENILSLPIDRYDDESIAVHEFCHTIDGILRRMDPAWTDRRNAAYEKAIAKGLWKDTYAAGNPGEFWAEVAQSYFDCNRVNNWNHGPVGTREQLKAYDPETYELVRATFNLQPHQDWRYTWLQPLPNIIPPPEKFGIDPYYTKFTWAREFPVISCGASDKALLKANDTVRKLFAFRHDILKALMAEDLKLVVLGPGESISDLPEYKNLANKESIDALARYHGYSPELKVLVVPEENILADPGAPNAGDNLVIRVFADAVYHVTAHRPVDPNWDKRGRAVQQYELRVQRLDERFGRALEELHASALEKGLWRGTAALHNPEEYWTAGILAYHDAAGQTAAPLGATHPIVTRELLKEYDPDLYALIHETMAREGRVDWRL